jgi:hypothetical protein
MNGYMIKAARYTNGLNLDIGNSPIPSRSFQKHSAANTAKKMVRNIAKPPDLMLPVRRQAYNSPLVPI